MARLTMNAAGHLRCFLPPPDCQRAITIALVTLGQSKRTLSTTLASQLICSHLDLTTFSSGWQVCDSGSLIQLLISYHHQRHSLAVLCRCIGLAGGLSLPTHLSAWLPSRNPIQTRPVAPLAAPTRLSAHQS